MRSGDRPLLSPFRIAIVYLAFGSLALVFSDVLLVWLIVDPTDLRRLQALKGAVEVVLTAGLIFALVATYRRSLDRRRREIERARDRFAFLNSLLRHHVLNRMNVVQGYVNELLEGSDGESDRPNAIDRERLETIQRQSAAVVDLVENVRKLTQRPGAGYGRHRLDLSAVVEEAVRNARRLHPDAVIDARIPDGVSVYADDSISLVFENVLTNAIRHNDADVPRVTVEVDAGRDDEAIAVSVADNGPGIPEEALLDPVEGQARGDEGFGLVLSRTLVARYDGAIDVAPTEPRGAAVTITLPRPGAGGEAIADGEDDGGV